MDMHLHTTLPPAQHGQRRKGGSRRGSREIGSDKATTRTGEEEGGRWGRGSGAGVTM